MAGIGIGIGIGNAEFPGIGIGIGIEDLVFRVLVLVLVLNCLSVWYCPTSILFMAQKFALNAIYRCLTLQTKL